MFNTGTPPAGVSLPCTAVIFFSSVHVGSAPSPVSGVGGDRLGTPSWDLNFADVGDGGAFGHVVRQQSERVVFAAGLNRPPDRVPAGAARGQGRPVAQRAVVAFE